MAYTPLQQAVIRYANAGHRIRVNDEVIWRGHDGRTITKQFIKKVEQFQRGDFVEILVHKERLYENGRGDWVVRMQGTVGRTMAWL